MMKQKRKYIDLLYVLVVVGLVGLFTSSIQMYANAQRTETVHTEDPNIIKENISLKTDLAISQLPFAVDSLCLVKDQANTLDSFFDDLDMLRRGKDTVISIVHLGDSHIQAGSYSGKVMRLLQQNYGNAGRGWIAPFKLSKSNEPDDYFISSVAKEWTAGRCIQNDPKCPVGIGGIGIQTESTFISFNVSMTPNNGAGYGFNRIVLYRGEKSMPMLPSGYLKDSTSVQTGSIPLYGVVTDTFNVSVLTDSLQLQSTRRLQGTDSVLPADVFTNLYYGFNLMNGQPGVLYHSIGVNGAMFVNYSDENYIQQLSLLKPSLLIVSLGTNETFGKRFNSNQFTEQIEVFLSLMKRYMPSTAILLTTPPECYKKARVKKKTIHVRNEETEQAARAIVKVAQKEQVACFDLFAATGGKHSNKQWYIGKWMGRDRIHFNKEGYAEQGVLLFNALMNLKAQRDDEK